MAGPLDLRGRAIITDGASGPLRSIKGNLDAVGSSAKRLSVMQNALASGAVAMNKATGAVLGAAGGAYAITNVLRKAEEFNKNIFGVGAAVLTDSAKMLRDDAGVERVVYDIEKVQATMRGVEKMTLNMSKELGQTPSRISGIAEVLAKAGFEAEKLEAATRATAIVSATDLETPVGRIAEFADVLQTIYKPRDGEKWGEFFTRQMDLVRIAAAETRLSVGSMMEGLRPFSALYARAGNSEYENAMMLMAGVKAGGEATEIGHTHKSNLVRFMRMTPEGANVFSSLGLRRGDYTDLSAMDPTRTASNLARAFRGANIKGKFRAELEADIEKALKGGYMDHPEFIGKLMDSVAKRGKIDMTNQNSREAFENQFSNAMFASGMKVKMLKLYQDLLAKNTTPGQYATVFEGRRIGSIMQIMMGIEQHLDQFKGKTNMAGGAGLDASQKVYDESSYGRLQRFWSMMEQFQIKLANSAGFEAFLNGVTRMFDLLGQIPKPITDVATAAGVAAIALAPLALAIKALGVVLAPLKWLLGMGAGAAGGAALARAGLGAGAVGPPVLAAGGAAAGLGMWNRLKGAGGRLLRGAGALGALMMGWEGATWLDGLLPGGAMLEGGDKPPRFFPGGSAQGGGAAHAAGASPLPGPMPGGAWEQDGAAGPAASQGQMQAAVQAAQEAAQQITATFAAIDLTGEGQRIGESLAAGLRSGLASAVAAVEEAGAQISAAASRINLNTGPAMQGAR